MQKDRSFKDFFFCHRKTVNALSIYEYVNDHIYYGKNLCSKMLIKKNEEWSQILTWEDDQEVETRKYITEQCACYDTT